MSRTKQLTRRIVLLVIVTVITRTWLIEGLLVPFRITGGSMAETLLGQHCEITCGDCGRPFCYDLREPPTAGRVVCPNCGHAEDDLGKGSRLDGDRLLVAKSAFLFRDPRRWEVVAFRHPGRAGEVCVKRVVGLPGETVEIRSGDVFVDGRIQRKTLPQQRAMAVEVYNANFPPGAQATAPPRWSDDLDVWRRRGATFVCPTDSNGESIAWLTYRHWRRTLGGDQRAQHGPIQTRLGYNHQRHQRTENIHDAFDVLLSFRLVEASGQGRIWIRATDGKNEFLASLAAEPPAWEVFAVIPEGKERLARGAIRGTCSDLNVEISLVDRQFLLAVGGEPVFRRPFEREDTPLPPLSGIDCPLAIGSDGLGVALSDFRVFRDVYYHQSLGRPSRSLIEPPCRVGPDSYFVLGDNSLASEDSRDWADRQRVTRGLLVGKPFLVHFPARRIDWGKWSFQVPDFAKIRYIR